MKKVLINLSGVEDDLWNSLLEKNPHIEFVAVTFYRSGNNEFKSNFSRLHHSPFRRQKNKGVELKQILSFEAWRGNLFKKYGEIDRHISICTNDIYNFFARVVTQEKPDLILTRGGSMLMPLIANSVASDKNITIINVTKSMFPDGYVLTINNETLEDLPDLVLGGEQEIKKVTYKIHTVNGKPPGRRNFNFGFSITIERIVRLLPFMVRIESLPSIITNTLNRFYTTKPRNYGLPSYDERDSDGRAVLIALHRPFIHNIDDVVKEIIEFTTTVVPESWKIILRPHPAEDSLFPISRQELGKLKSRGAVISIDDNIDQMIDRVCLVITIKSLVGLRALLKGVPVMTIAQSFYSFDGGAKLVSKPSWTPIKISIENDELPKVDVRKVSGLIRRIRCYRFVRKETFGADLSNFIGL